MAGSADDLGDLLAGPAGAARRPLVEGLLARGCTPKEIRAAHERDRLSLLPLELTLRDDGSASLEEIAERRGVDPEALASTRRALGLTVERGQPVYGAALDDHARRLSAALAAGMPVEALLAINRVIGRAMAAVAAASRDAMQALLADAEVDESARGLRAAEAAEALVPELDRVLAYAFAEHVRELVRLEAGARLVDVGAADVREVGIAFADLVGFTSLGDRLTPRELGGVAERLESLAFDALRPGVTVVKTIGDEVMLAAADLPALVATVLDLLAAADRSADLPQLRAGAAAGPTMHRAGDWYGQAVNLASRLTALAEPGTLAADAAVHAAAPSAAAWDAGRAVEVRGHDAPVVVRRARP